MRNILIVAALFLSTTNLLSAQSMASLSNVNQAKLEVSNAVHFIEQNILLALTAGVLFLGIIFVCYVVKEYTNSNQTQKTKHNHFLSLIVLVVGTGLFCSSCGVAQQMHAASPDLTQEYIQQGCPITRPIRSQLLLPTFIEPSGTQHSALRYVSSVGRGL